MKIEKNIPLPEPRKKGGFVKYQFLRNMDVGDSVYIKGEGSQDKTAMSARSYGYRCNKRFQSLSDDSGVRIWRIK